MTLSSAMLAIEISTPGGPDVLRPVSAPVPVPGHGQIIVRLACAGVNRPDALQRAGAYAPPPSAEVSSRVSDHGSQAPDSGSGL